MSVTNVNIITIGYYQKGSFLEPIPNNNRISLEIKYYTKCPSLLLHQKDTNFQPILLHQVDATLQIHPVRFRIKFILQNIAIFY